MTITAPETTITVEDAEAARSLPVGIVLKDDSGDFFRKLDSELDEYELTFGEENGGYVSAHNYWYSYDIDFPAIVQNPEILDFAADPVHFNVGDRVRIVEVPEDVNQRFHGVTGTVIEGGTNPRVEPDEDRPDGHGRHPFFFSRGAWELITDEVEEPVGFQVGDRVVVNDSVSCFVRDFVGLTGTIESVSSAGNPYVKPDTARPDGHGTHPFYLEPHSWDYLTEDAEQQVDVYVAPLGTAIEETLAIITDPFDLDPLPIGSVIRSTDGNYLAVKTVGERWLNPASADPANFLWTALAGLGASTVGVEVLFQPDAA